MRKLTCALAAAAAIAAGVPTLANAGEVGIYVNGDHGYYRDRHDGPRFRERDREFRHGYFHRDYDDRDVVIRHHHWDHD